MWCCKGAQLPNAKLDQSQLLIELLKREHLGSVKAFSCGREDEDEFLHTDALPNQNVKLSETYLLLEKGKSKIISYITITVGSFNLSGEKKFHNVKIMDKPYRVYANHMPCLLVGKLATDKSEAGRGGATYLIDYAIKKALDANLPIPFIALHAYPDMVSFYQKLGFNIAFSPLKTARTVTVYMEIPHKIKPV